MARDTKVITIMCAIIMIVSIMGAVYEYKNKLNTDNYIKEQINNAYIEGYNTGYNDCIIEYLGLDSMFVDTVITE